MKNTITRVKFVNDFKSQCHLAFCACKVVCLSDMQKQTVGYASDECRMLLMCFSLIRALFSR